MNDHGTPLHDLPSRRLTVNELDELAGSERFLTTIHDDETLEVEGIHLLAANCVFVTEDSISAAIYDEDEETWYRVYTSPREETGLTEAYDAVRAARDNDVLFSRQPRTVDGAVYAEDIPTQTETSGYEAEDDFDCPVCGDVHTVQFHEDEEMREYDQDTSALYVECSEAGGGRLYVEMQANTPP